MTIAFLFPGQGSQSVGMMDVFSEVRVVKDTFEEASVILQQDMWQLAHAGSEDQLALTTNTQPLMLISDVAMYRAWIKLGGKLPSILAGHSLGEYAALVASGALNFTDAVPLVRQRSELMQNAVPSGVGAMAAVLGLSDENITLACQNATAEGGVAEPANYNAPGQVVIAGNKETVEKAVEEAKKLGAKRAMLLAMSTPSHCSLIKPAANLFASVLDTVSIGSTEIPVVHNENVQESSTAQDIKERLYQQLFKPVRWVETIRHIVKEDIRIGCECGPGKVITGLNKRIDKEFQMISLASPEAMELAMNEFSGG
ncbi:MAG: ACP S-malonyltransferase [Proteobacteria bacterium]|nr:ACP S-malonyltransferase [Pseudomonadota bacterium]MDA1012488.1 ACP S-malonyltransferase [Pseudomonadota bacterium]